MAKVELNPDLENIVADMIRKSPLQEEWNEKARSILRDVNGQMKGGNFDAILAELVSRFTATGLEPNIPTLRDYAQSIADGTLQ